MRLTPAPSGNEVGQERTWFVRPTLRRVLTTGAGLLLTGAASVLLLVPAVFYLLPIPSEADAATLCLPGIGPLQRFREDLRPELEEQTYIHEGVHAVQCRTLGATAYARRAATPEGRLTLEAEALCAEVAVLWKRGGDRQRLLDWVVETLQTEYFEGGSVAGRDIAAAVDRVCGEAVQGRQAPSGDPSSTLSGASASSRAGSSTPGDGRADTGVDRRVDGGLPGGG